MSEAMTDERLAELAQVVDFGTILAGDRADLSGLLAEVRRLRAENESMREAFADLCIDKDALRLAREAGRLEALRWAFADRQPDDAARGWIWKRAFVDPENGEEHLPPEVFALLSAPEPADGWATRWYDTRETALADRGQALARLARKWIGA